MKERYENSKWERKTKVQEDREGGKGGEDEKFGFLI
jgi:hypothetical protein